VDYTKTYFEAWETRAGDYCSFDEQEKQWVNWKKIVKKCFIWLNEIMSLSLKRGHSNLLKNKLCKAII